AAVAAGREPARPVAAGAWALPHHDPRHARAHRGRPVRAATAGGATAEHVREDAGAEVAARVVGEEAVEAHPAAGLPVPGRPGGRIERVDVDVAPVAVGGVADAVVAEAVHRLVAIRELAVEVVVLAAVDPVPLQPQD